MELISTIPMRCIDMLISRRRKYGEYTIFSGVDDQSRDFDEFYAQITHALDLLPARLGGRIELADLMPKRIIGTAFYTQFWRHPKSLEINYDQTYSVPACFVAGEMLFEILRQYFSQQEAEDESLKKAKEIEYRYIDNLLEDVSAKEEYERYRAKRPATSNERRIFLRKFMRKQNAKIKKQCRGKH